MKSKITHEFTQIEHSWNEAISDAESKIEEAKQRIESLREAIRIFRKRLKNGDPWPGDEYEPLSNEEIQQIQILLMDTDLSMPMIAERMHCDRISVMKINNEFQIRSHKGERQKSKAAGKGA